MHHKTFHLAIAGVLLLSLVVFAQDKKPVSPLPQSPNPQTGQEDDQEQLKIFTEEVRLPVLALDVYGHFDPTVGLSDILILEDGVAQEVKSIRKIPANVLLLLDTGGEGIGTGGMSKSTWTTREVAKHIAATLPKDDAIAVMQFSDTVDLLQDWTFDRELIDKMLTRKLHSGHRARLSDALTAAVTTIKQRPEGARHVVIVTDGVGTPNPRIDLKEAVRQLVAAHASVDVISYTQLVLQKAPSRPESVYANQKRSADAIASAIDPTMPPGTSRGGIGGSPTAGVGITFDPAMRRKRKAYEAEVKSSEKWLTELAQNTGGQVFLPKTEDEMISEGDRVARDIGAEYYVTYRPKRPLAEAVPGEYRKIEIAPRRSGLKLTTMRGYIAKP